MNSTSKIEKSMSRICRGVDKKDDAMMMMAPESNWDQFLTHAPFAIAVLEDLILVSADTDFSLEDKPPKDGFRLIRYPNSFRESLVQVRNTGWSAFNEAHTNMDQIRLRTGYVDDHVKSAVLSLMKGSPEELQRMLPIYLNSIQNIADESLRLSEATEVKFVGVMELIGELLDVIHTLVSRITLSHVRKQWRKLALFFEMLSNLIKCCLHSSLTEFVDQCKIGRELNNTAPQTNIFREIIFEQASEASQIAYVVHTISATYVDISNKHLMDRMASPGRWVALNPQKDQRQIIQRREELYSGCQKAQQEIQSIAKKQKEEFNRRIDGKISKLEELKAKMPAIEPAKIREIQQTVSIRFAEEELDELI